MVQLEPRAEGGVGDEVVLLVMTVFLVVMETQVSPERWDDLDELVELADLERRVKMAGMGLPDMMVLMVSPDWTALMGMMGFLVGLVGLAGRDNPEMMGDQEGPVIPDLMVEGVEMESPVMMLLMVNLVKLVMTEGM